MALECHLWADHCPRRASLLRERLRSAQDFAQLDSCLFNTVLAAVNSLTPLAARPAVCHRSAWQGSMFPTHRSADLHRANAVSGVVASALPHAKRFVLCTPDNGVGGTRVRAARLLYFCSLVLAFLQKPVPVFGSQIQSFI